MKKTETRAALISSSTWAMRERRAAGVNRLLLNGRRRFVCVDDAAEVLRQALTRVKAWLRGADLDELSLRAWRRDR